MSNNINPEDLLDPTENQTKFNQYDMAQTIINKSSQDKFLVILDVPKMLYDNQSKNIRNQDFVNRNKWQFSVSKITIPEVAIPSIDIPFYGQTIQVTSQTRTKYSPLQITYSIDNNYDNYHLLISWFNKINDSLKSGVCPEIDIKKNQYINYMKNNAPKSDTPSNFAYQQINHVPVFLDYMTTITVFATREYDEKIFKWTFTHCFPTNVGGIDFDYTSTQPISSQATFAIGQMQTELLSYSEP